ncbi:MAG: hypothetical protein ACLTWM_02680 [Collinsella bouchesdurhonensis]
MIQGRPNHAQRRAGRAGAEHVEGGFAYKIIQEMNEGQIKKGRAVVKGRVRSNHFEARCFAGDEDARL